MSSQSRTVQHFERLYRDHPDPWNFENSRYEQQKYQATLGALDGRKFRSGFEAGCSIGVLTSQIAQRCERLMAVDCVAAAVTKAQARCASLPHVSIQQMQIPRQWPKGRFDLVIFSEVLYFLNEDDLSRTWEHTARSLLPTGLVLLVNYTGVTDDPISGEDAASRFIEMSSSELRPILQSRQTNYRLDLLARY